LGRKIMYLPEIDYLVSLQTFCMGKEEEEKDFDLVMEDTSLIWEKYLEDPDMVFVYQDACTIFKSRMFNAMINHHVLKKSVDDLLAISGDELYHHLLDYREMDAKKREYPEIVYAEIERTINESYNKREEDLIVFKELIFNADSFKSRLDNILKTTYKIFTEDIFTKEVEASIKKVVEKFQQQLDTDEAGFSDSVTIFSGSDYQKLPEELTLCLLYFASQQYIVMLKDMLVLFGREIPKYVKHYSEDSRIEVFLKALADPIRYQMFKRLAKTPTYGAELARDIGISHLEMEKHISYIQRARLLTAMKGEKNRIYFQITKEDLKKRLEELKSDLLQ